ncbi:hypothetical protein [Maritimibacter sp. DP1N21-5]|uniref:hypothetical protein n=1 Tax=Maritimibacter sp. DP1N21-5 TaxID=2836867 RepID=UPI001C46C2A3|nr:hypothetical protein [Maritimibacter sp. DP1N21-5]MBV7410012.1 hypothetical protein [Maritimibacter sp. DP1N21-5]
MLQAKELRSLYGAEEPADIDRHFREDRQTLADRHRRMAEDTPKLTRTWTDGRFALQRT